MKKLILHIYKILNTINILFICLIKNKLNDSPVLFLNGALSGSYGGPKVKVKRLKKIFQNSKINPNIFYCLSNCIYSYNYIVKKYLKFKIPIIYNQNGIFHNVWYKGNVNNKNREMKFYLINADYVFYQSKFCKQCCDNNIYQRTKNFKILYNAVDTNFFIPGNKIKTSLISILKVGIYNKSNMWRLVEVIKAMHKVNINKKYNYKLSIVGPVEKNVKKEINDLIHHYDIRHRVSFLGKIKQDKIVETMQKHHIFLTTKIYDPCSNTIIEAMSCGLPVVFHNSGGNYELVKNAGWSFGKKNKNIEKIKVNHKDITSVLEGIKLDEITKKSESARYRAKIYFNILKWEKEHRKIFEYYIKNNKT